MRVFKENDFVRIMQAAKGDAVEATGEYVPVPAGSTGTIVNVVGDPNRPSRYDIEFFFQERCEYVLALVDAPLVELGDAIS